MKTKRKSRYRVINKDGAGSVTVEANSAGHAMALASREREWPNRGSDAEGYFGYSIDRVGKVAPVSQ